MNGLLKLCLFAVLLCIYSCGAKQGSTGKENVMAKNNAQNPSSEKMIEQGFSKGTIKASKIKGCPYILNVDTYDDNLDPINLGEFFEGEIPPKVWVKFSNLRMASRCSEARPVSISEVSKREE